MDTEQKEQILTECREMMTKSGYDVSKIDQFCEIVEDILQELIDYASEDREIRYKLVKRLDRIEFKLDISGDEIDPLEEGKGAENRVFQNKMNSMLFNPETSISTSYKRGWNHLVVKSPSKIANSKLLNEPMVKAMILGIIAGIFVRFLPDETKTLVLEGIAAPIMSTVISLLMGIMGPVFFLFIIVAAGSLGSMDELSKIGKVIIKRFVIITFWVALITTVVGLLFFPIFGSGDTIFDLPAIEGVILGTLPTDFISPFIECNVPQVILLALIFGTALLMMGESGDSVRQALIKIKEWVMSVMVLMMKVLPLVPFISTMMMVATSSFGIFLRGWRYIAAAYVCYILMALIEFVTVSVRCKISISNLWKVLKEIITMAFVTATPAATMQMSYEVSERDFGIDSSLSEVWIPLSNNLLSPSRTISLVLSVLFIADMARKTVDIPFIIIMIIAAVQLSLASTGAIAGATVILETLKLPVDSLGIFSAFDVFTRNAGAALDIIYSMLDQLDAARETGKRTGEEQVADAE